MLIIILQFCIYVDLCTLFADLVEMNKYSASCNGLGVKWIGNGYRRFGYHPHITVDAAMIGEIQGVLGFTGRKGFVIAIVDENGKQTRISCLYTIGCQIQSKREITTNMLLNTLSIQVKNLFSHSCLKMDQYPFTFGFCREYEMFAIPGGALIIAASASFGRHQLYRMRSGNNRPRTVVKVDGFRAMNVSFEKSPSRIEIIHLSPATGKLDESGNRCFGTVGFCCLSFLYQ